MLPLAQSEAEGARFARTIGATSLAALRGLPAEHLLTSAEKFGMFSFRPNIDGDVLTDSPRDIYERGGQNRVSLLAGWNAAEGGTPALARGTASTPQGFKLMAQRRFGNEASEFLKLYPAQTIRQTHASFAAFNGDSFIAFGTWNWINTHRDTAHVPVYRYFFEQVRPDAPSDVKLYQHPSSVLGARHASEIEYVFGTLDFEPDVPWREQDRKVSDAMVSYWTNYARSGDPNGSGLPQWPKYEAGTQYSVMHIGPDLHAAPEANRARYEFLKEHPPKALPRTTRQSR
jgi:para-nitrobenzyl esterase